MTKDATTTDAMTALTAFETNSLRMEAMLELCFLAPPEDVDRVMGAVIALTPLLAGKYDSNAYESGGGIERYRPLEGAAAGAEPEVRRRPGMIVVSFQLPRDPALLERVIEAIFQAHSYQEPTITVKDVLVSRSKGLDDRHNPNRWWNTTGDWKKAANPQ